MKKNKPIDFWKPLPKKKGSTKGYAMIPMPFDLKIKPVSKLKKIELNYPQAKRKYPKLNPYGDADRDGTKNWLDCKPFNPKKHGAYIASKKKGKRILLYDNYQEKGDRKIPLGFQGTHTRLKHKGDIYRTMGREAMNDLMMSGKIRGRNKYNDVSYSKRFFGQTLGSRPHVTFRVSTNKQKDKIYEMHYKKGIFESEQEFTTKGDSAIPAKNIVGIRYSPSDKTRYPREIERVKEYAKRNVIPLVSTGEDLENDKVINRYKELNTIPDFEQPKAEAIIPIVKRTTEEAPEKKAMRLRHGATEIRTINAAEFKRKYEDYRKGYPDRKDVEEHIILDNSSLPWNKIRLEQARSRNFDNAYPEVVIGTNRVEVNDGRHRITAAAEKGQEIDVAVVPEEWTDEDTLKEIEKEVKEYEED